MKINYFLFLIILMLFFSCKNEKKDNTITSTESPAEIKEIEKEPKFSTLPEWAINANIYEVNIRQYSKEGTFNAFTKELPRLKKMGVDILWLMPIYPIGEIKRKGSLGSYYSVKDFKAVNPDHGTMADFKLLVAKAHDLDMKVILDWVPNHSAWDNDWIKEYPEWYTHDNDTITHPLNEEGNPTGWTDVADFNYENKEFRLAMIDALKYWVKEANIDGYRCDVAGFVPNDFWKEANAELSKGKKLFMLAEWDNEPEHFNSGFHMNYSWAYKDLIKEIAHGKKNTEDIWKFYEEQENKFPEHAIHMYFITNHDENSWNNFPAILGDAEKALAVLSHTFDGMPLIYSGQESGLPDTISFFHKDEFEWGNFKNQEFYTKLNELKHTNNALANGVHGGKMERIELKQKNIFAFSRSKGNDKVEVYINLSKESIIIRDINKLNKKYMSEGVKIIPNKDMQFDPWGYIIYSNK